MVGSYSPHGDGGGTLHCPSPTHIHVDPASAFKQLRRSLSRSPSKVPVFRLVTSKSTSPSPSSPLSPPRDLLSNRSISASIIPLPHSLSPSPLSSPQPFNARKTRPSTRRLSPMRNPSLSTAGHKSPRKRTLQESSSQGNRTPQSSAPSSDDQENRGSISPTEEPLVDVVFKSGSSAMQKSPSAPARATTRFEKGNSWGAKSSPLKRSDGIMNLDQTNAGSPAKRRSLHSGIFNPDFDIFDHQATFETQPDVRMTDSGSELETSSHRDHMSPMPKRTSSLRKTTLQQRHDKPSFVRSKPNTDLALDFATPGQAASKSRFRMSLDSALPAMPRDSPFSSQGSLPNASAHPVSHQGAKQNATISSLQSHRHPLSRTISQSTSNSSMAEDSPTHIPIRQPEQRRTYVDFSKSLPVGAAPPRSQESDPSQGSSNLSFATPENYKLVKPLPAAFMSTGLISKRHKHLDNEQSTLGASTSTMPDTPCKRHSLAELPSPKAPVPESFVKSHHARHSFGTPSTPFNPQTARATPGTLGKGVSIFGSGFGNHGLHRSASFLSVEGDDQLQSPPEKGESQSSTEFDVSSTPTKQANAPGSDRRTHFGSSTSRNGYKSPGFGISVGAKTQSFQPEQSCKSFPPGTLSGSVDGDSDGLLEESPSAALRTKSFSMMPRSFTHSRLARNWKSPTPLNKTSVSAPVIFTRKSNAKSSPLSPVSPPNGRSFLISPKTPHHGVVPPDPSGLSISVYGDENVRSSHKTTGGVSIVPQTPTAPKEPFLSFNKSRSSVTPSHVPTVVEVDPILTAKFDKVELIGTGEFSQVYRVARKQEFKTSRTNFSMPLARSSPRTSLPDKVWAVKKARNAFIGPRDRKRKMQEVNTLKALGQMDHTVQLIDSWEAKGFLYIQTEFCEEGSLDMFLDQVGRKARLDDFRVWKILLELSLGLKHVHESGFIHLDIKPANILITFAGVLKIADFGLATHWPAQPGIDGEGDREYIGPEILRGQFDKPGDIFALGLIMLEIAANVMLPDNGASWQRLRTGDMSDVPSLTWSSENSNVLRDPSGKPLSQEESIEDFYGSDSEGEDFGSPKYLRHHREIKVKRAPFQLHRSGELAQPPAFMVDPNDPGALDKLVRWMISPVAADRPVANQILNAPGVQWAQTRRRAGATIFEGNWGPADEVLADDAEMIDV